MFKRIVNNQALLNGLRQVAYMKRETAASDDHETKVVPAGMVGNIQLVKPSTCDATAEFDQFFSELNLPANSAVLKIAKQIMGEQVLVSRIQEIAMECVNPHLSEIDQTRTMQKLESNRKIQQIEKQIEKDQFYGTNKMFVMDDQDLTTDSELPTKRTLTIEELDHSVASKTLSMDHIRRLLGDLVSSLKGIILFLRQKIFGNTEKPFAEVMYSNESIGKVSTNSVVIVVSFVLYQFVKINSPSKYHDEINSAFTEFISRLMASL